MYKRQTKTLNRKLRDEENLQNRRQAQDQISDTEMEAASSDEMSCHSNSETEQPLQTVVLSSSRNMTPLPTVARESERYNLSNTAAAAIVTATLIHYGLVSKDDLSMVVDAKKIHRARQKLRKSSISNKIFSDCSCIGIFFDGKRNKTLKFIVNIYAPMRFKIKSNARIILTEVGISLFS